MSDKFKQANRIPFENLQDNQVVSSWSLPSVNKKSRAVLCAKHTRQRSQVNQEVVENYKGLVKPKPLTAEELQKITEAAKTEGFEQGYQEGFALGEREGASKGEQDGHDRAYKEIKKQLNDECSRLHKIAGNLFEPMRAQEALLEKIIVDMAIQFAQQLIDREIQQSPDIILEIINRALSALPAGSSNISVFVNETDAATVDKYFPAEHRSWTLKTEAAIGTGGCRIETIDSLVNYTVESRLQEFIEQVCDQGDVEDSQATQMLSRVAAKTPANPLTVQQSTVKGSFPDSEINSSSESANVSHTTPGNHGEVEITDEPDRPA